MNYWPFFIVFTILTACNTSIQKDANQEVLSKDELWQAPDTNTLTTLDNADEIRYGRALIANTAYYLGPNGVIAPMSNGMNCQNCHLDAGTKPWGNNYSAVASTYPKFRARSGTEESIYKRVSDCFERSLNGNAPDSSSKEAQAIIAYINWLGAQVPKGEKPIGSGLLELALMERAASPDSGAVVYQQKCVACHQTNGQGLAKTDGSGYIYPPLWGANSYNQGAGLYRLSRFAGYVKANMPIGASFQNPILSDAEAWDVAAFVNTMPRPTIDISADWPDISKKPIDHPFGPYVDSFPEIQHKLGPFAPIKKFYAQK